jgi:hypothetical protein
MMGDGDLTFCDLGEQWTVDVTLSTAASISSSWVDSGNCRTRAPIAASTVEGTPSLRAGPRSSSLVRKSGFTVGALVQRGDLDCLQRRSDLGYELCCLSLG